MKNKIKLLTVLSVAFVLLLCTGVFDINDIAASAEQNNDEQAHTHCFCGGNVDVGDHSEHSDVTFAPWDGTNFDYDGEGGNSGVVYLYLTQDVVLNSATCNRTDSGNILSIATEQTVYLCLNGHSLKNGDTSNNVVDVYGSLYLCDCVGSGTVGGRTNGSNSGAIWLSNGKLYLFGGSLTGSHGLKNGGGIFAKDNSSIVMYGGAVTGNTATRQCGGVYLNGTSSFVMYDGIISDNSAPDFGGGVIVDDGTTFEMYGGTISNNFSGRSGGGVHVSGGTFVMHGGTISDNTAAGGGGVYVTYDKGRGSFTMYGGTVANNTAFANGGGVFLFAGGEFTLNKGSVRNNRAMHGGGVCMYTADNNKSDSYRNYLNLVEGKISENTATKAGGGVCCFEYSTINFKGAGVLTIDGNTTADNTEQSDLYFVDKAVINIEALADGSKIGISSMLKPDKGSPVKLNKTNADYTAYNDCFFSDSADYVTVLNDTSLTLSADCFKSTVNYLTGCDTAILPQAKSGTDERILMTVTNITPTATCRRFLGWSTIDNATEAQYTAGDEITVTDELTLYGVWETAHDLHDVAETKATCLQVGTKAHHICNQCGKLFVDDNDVLTEVTAEQLVVAGGHKFGLWQEAVEATTEKEGIQAHKDCEVCDKHFDANGNEIADLTTPKLPVEEKPVDDKKQDSLPSGAVVGITAGSIAGIEVIAYFVIKLIRKRRLDI